jgi:hypothetical protein
MPGKRHGPEQILNKLRQVEVAVAAARSLLNAPIRELACHLRHLAD